MAADGLEWWARVHARLAVRAPALVRVRFRVNVRVNVKVIELGWVGG